MWELLRLLSILSPTPTPLRSGAVPIYVEMLETLFLPEEVQEALELHFQRLCHRRGWPRRSPGAP